MKVCSYLGNKYARILIFVFFGLAFLFWPKQASANESYKFISNTTIEATGGSGLTSGDESPFDPGSGGPGKFVWDSGSGNQSPIFTMQGFKVFRECSVKFRLVNFRKGKGDTQAAYADLEIAEPNVNNCGPWTENELDQADREILLNGFDPAGAGGPLEGVPTEGEGGCEDAAGGGVINKVKVLWNFTSGQWGKVLYQQVVCPLVINITESITNVVKSSLRPLLVIEPLETNDDSEIYKVWKSFRDLSYVFLVMAILVIILANVLSINMDAYTMKKMLPRIVVVAVLIQMSFLICALIVDIGNVSGDGIGEIVSSLGSGKDPSATQGAVLGGIAVTGILVGLAVVGWAVILILALILALAWLLMFLALGVRYLLITILIVAAPLALLAWLLPNTEQYFRKWLNFFFRLVLMYPLIMLILSMAGKIGELLPTGDTTDGVASAASAIMKVVAFIAAFGMIPWTFKWAGGAMAIAGNAMMKAGKRGAKSAAKSQTAKDIAQRRKEKALQRAGGPRGLGTGLAKLRAGGVAGLVGTSAAKRRMGAARGKVMKERGDEFEDLATERGWGTKELEKMALGGSHDGFQPDEAGQARAIQMLGQKAGWDALRRVQGRVASSTWSHGTKAIQGDLYTKAPDIPKGEAKAFESFSPAELKDMHFSTVKKAMEYMPKADAGTQRRMVDTAVQMATSPDLKDKVSPQTLGYLFHMADKFDKVPTAAAEIHAVINDAGDGKGKIA